MNQMQMTEKDERRFWAKVRVPNASGCMVWAASISGGYGEFRLGDKRPRAHRVSYELLVGPIPDGLQLDHLCHNPACVAPDHLEPVTGRVNVLRGNTITGANARKTHCPAGHPYDVLNTRISSTGKRHCRACARERDRRKRRRKAVS